MLRVELRGHLSSSVHVDGDIQAVPINFQLGTKTQGNYVIKISSGLA